MNNIKRVLSISGTYGSGKTYLANSLEKSLPNCQHIAFSDTLRQLCCLYYPEQASNIYADRKTPETRQLMYKVAEDYQNRFGWAVFIDEAFTRVKPTTELLIISDVRFAKTFKYLDDKFENKNTFVYLGNFTTDYEYADLFANYEITTFEAKPDLNKVISKLELN